ncbi:unnamed protein product [Scytosiphon promiscuus]
MWTFSSGSPARAGPPSERTSPRRRRASSSRLGWWTRRRTSCPRPLSWRRRCRSRAACPLPPAPSRSSEGNTSPSRASGVCTASGRPPWSRPRWSCSAIFRNYLRHGRTVHQDQDGHAGHEARHGGCGRRPRGVPGGGEGPDSGPAAPRSAVPGGEFGRRERDSTRRHPHALLGENGGDQQHRRRRPPCAERRRRVRRETPQPVRDRGRGHPDRRPGGDNGAATRLRLVERRGARADGRGLRAIVGGPRSPRGVLPRVFQRGVQVFRRRHEKLGGGPFQCAGVLRRAVHREPHGAVHRRTRGRRRAVASLRHGFPGTSGGEGNRLRGGASVQPTSFA